jgi:hypothetical protein
MSTENTEAHTKEKRECGRRQETSWITEEYRRVKKEVKNIRKAKRRFEKKLAAGGRWQQVASLCLCQPVDKKAEQLPIG